VLLTIPDQLLTSLLSNVLDVRHQVSHPYKTTDKVTALYIYIFFPVLRQQTGKRKILDRMAASSL